MRPIFIFPMVALAIIEIASGDAAAQVRQSALPAEQSRGQIELATGFEARVLASEPQVIDPVDVAFDDAGRMWVVEMRDYPFRVGDVPQGRIRILSDTNNDGRFDSATVFADQLEMPTGLAHWKNGLVVTLAGKLIYLQDTDGDMVADQTQVWLEGFSEDNEQLRANHPRLGPDGKWTIASGLRGGNIKLGSAYSSSDKEPLPLAIGSRDVRFDPATGSVELITGPAQFGLCFDLFGSRYFCSNRNPAVKVVFEQEDLVGNPLAGILPSVVDVVPAGEQSQVFPLVNAWTTSNLHSGQFTAACGVFVRTQTRSDSLSESSLLNEIYTCEPTGCLVKRSLVSTDGQRLPTPSSDSPPEQREWLASRDDWFRPVNVAHSPDGALIIVDMHRAVIEHPQWVPDELKNRPDERWGDDCGRVFWIGDSAAQHLSATIKDLQSRPLGTRSDAELVNLVAGSNAWLRETAARLLIERESHQSSQQLVQRSLAAVQPIEGRIAALVLAVELLEKVPSNFVAEQLENAPPLLQVALLRALRQSQRLRPEHTDRIAQAAMAVDRQVGFEALLCLGNLTAEGAIAFPNADEICLAASSANDPYMLVAAASAMRVEPERLLIAWLGTLNEFSSSTAESHTSAIARGLAAACVKRGATSEATFAAVASAAAVTGADLRKAAALAALTEMASRDASLAGKLLDDPFWDDIAHAIQQPELPLQVRSESIEMLSLSPRSADARLLGQLAQASRDPALKTRLMTAWAKQGSAECDDVLIGSLASSSPAVMVTLLQLIGQSPQRLMRFTDELAAGRITARQIGATELKKLVTRATGETKNALQKELDGLVNSDRAKVLAEYQPSLELNANAQRGKEVFRTQCASCHRIADVGVDVGPDISDSRTQKPVQLLTSILNPNLAIDNNYFRYIILTKDDEIVEGMVAEETADAIVIRGQENKRTVIARDEIAELKATGVSMMPEGLEAQINQQAMADLIGYIKDWRYLDGAIPGK